MTALPNGGRVSMVQKHFLCGNVTPSQQFHHWGVKFLHHLSTSNVHGYKNEPFVGLCPKHMDLVWVA